MQVQKNLGGKYLLFLAAKQQSNKRAYSTVKKQLHTTEKTKKLCTTEGTLKNNFQRATIANVVFKLFDLQ